MSERRRVTVGLIVIILAAFAVRIYRLDHFALRGDESFTVIFTSLPDDALFEGIRSLEPNPPLYYYVFRGWMGLFGTSDFSVRYFSLLFGTLLVPLIFVLARALGGVKVGLVAAALIAFNPFQIYHSQDVRNYTLWPALIVLSSWLLWRALRHGRVRDWFGYGLVSLVALYTHYFTVFFVIAENIFTALLIFWRGLAITAYADRRWRLLRTWIIVQSILVIGFLPWLLIGSSHALAYTRAGSALALDEMLRRTLQALLIGESIPKSEVLWLLLAPLVLVIVGGFVMARRQGVALLWLLSTSVVPFVGLFLVIQTRPFYEPRYLNNIAPSLYILGAAGIVGLMSSRRWRVVAAIGASAWLLIAIYAYGRAQFDPRFAKSPDWQSRVAYLELNQQPGDAIIYNYPDPSFGYYYRGAAPFQLIPRSYPDDRGRAEMLADLRDLLARYRRIWLFSQLDREWDSDGMVEKWLNHTADRVWHGSVSGMPAQIYETPAVFTSHLQPLNVDFSDNVRLLGYRLAAERVPPGQPLELVLYWQTSDRVPHDYNVFTHLLNAEGAVVAQQDNAPAHGTYPTSQWQPGEIIVDAYELALPPDLPPGDYPLEFGMYDWTTGVRLKTASGDDRVLLPVKVRVE